MFASCIDIGGTFTDLVVHETGRGLSIFKSPTTPGEFEVGFMNALTLAAEHYGLSLPKFLAQNELIVHGTTVSTNALVENKAAPVGLICNAGHPDVLTIREAPRKRAFTVHIDYPPPYVPRNRTREVRGRIEALGRELEPLSEPRCHRGGRVLQALRSAGHRGEPSLVHRQSRARTPGARDPRGPLARDSGHLEPRDQPHTAGVSPHHSHAIDASLYPIVASYTRRLVAALKEAGYQRELLIANCIGGMMPPEEIVRRPIYSVMSGPTLAPVAGLHLTDIADVVVVDMGGTTFDVSAIRNRHIVVTPESTFGMEMLGIPKIDVRSVGAGGGSIAQVDAGGMLKVGPRSASAYPGPACYGRGGTAPTVTDANLVLGIIDANNFLGGRMRLDTAAAERALGGLAAQLGLTLRNTAWAIYTTINHNMIARDRRCHGQRGHRSARELHDQRGRGHGLSHRRHGAHRGHPPLPGAEAGGGFERLWRVAVGFALGGDRHVAHQQPRLSGPGRGGIAEVIGRAW